MAKILSIEFDYDPLYNLVNELYESQVRMCNCLHQKREIDKAEKDAKIRFRKMKSVNNDKKIIESSIKDIKDKLNQSLTKEQKELAKKGLQIKDYILTLVGTKNYSVKKSI